MINIFRYIKKSMGPLIFIIALLILQAYCDLSLPTYTSKIVDVGIAKNGIDELIPTQIRESELLKIQLFLEDGDAKVVENAYEASDESVDGDVIYNLVTTNEEELKKVQECMADPITLFGLIESMTDENGKFVTNKDSALKLDSSMDMGTIMQMMFNPQTPKEQRIMMLDQIMDQFGDLKDSMNEKMSASYIEAEYDAIGINMDHYQMVYLLKEGLKMILVAVIAMCTSIFVSLLASRVAAKTAMNLRTGVFEKVVHFSNAEMDQFSIASLITRNTNDIQQVQMVMVMLLRMVIYAPILGIGGVIKVMQTNASMSWIIITAVAVIMFIVIFLFIVAMPKFKLMQVLVDKVNLVAREILTGIPVIRAFGTERHEEKRFDAANNELASTQLFTNRVMAFMMPIMIFIMNLISVAIIWFGGKGIDAGTMQVGEMMAFMTYAMQIVFSFLMLTMISIMLPRAGVAAKRIDEVIHTEITIRDKEHTVKPTQKGNITFHQVSFKFPNASGNAIEDISFTAKPGETTAIIGSTGSGKSTVVNLIPRFYDVSEGMIQIDGQDIRDISLHDLRQMIGYVPQKGVLFSGTIESNIRYGCDDLNHERVEKAAEIAQAIEFIEEKDEKYESSISQGGTNVSGGQKQRLSIARAIAKDPQIYIFDDSFSALDYKTDVALRKKLKEETSNSTVLIVAQRISTVLQAEQIIVLDEGKIVGCGTHKELLKSCEVYKQIATSQLSENEITQSLEEKEDLKHE